MRLPRPAVRYSARMVRVVKGHGLGNDYLVVRAADLPGGGLAADAARALCDRHRGLGADGVLVHVASARADVGVRIFNPDGSEAEKSGNGLRIFAKYLWDHGHVRGPRFTVDTAGGVVSLAGTGTAGTAESPPASTAGTGDSLCCPGTSGTSETGGASGARSPSISPGRSTACIEK